MSNLNPSQLTAWTGSIDIANDLVMVWKHSNSTLYKATPNQLANLTSQWVGINDTQTLTAKTLTSPTISGPTLSGTITGTYTIGGTPTFPASVVTLTGSQTLTNKILTSPTINSPTITNATITANALTGFTTSNTGTVYGISVALGVITTANSVNGTALVNSSVTPSKFNTGAQVDYVAASESTTSTTYTALTTPGPITTVTIGANGLALVNISGDLANSSTSSEWMAFAISGATTIAASDDFSVASTGTGGTIIGITFLVTGLTPGVNVFTAQYRVNGNTGTFGGRRISVVPL